jgi:hypothetical protein
MKRILFFFLDGVGLGPATDANPLAHAEGTALTRLAGGQRWTQPFRSIASETHLVRAIDATLGVEGLPQSGTGQASLLTGTNCAALVGRHFGPFPHSKTHPVLDADNLFHQVSALPDRDRPVAFANAFPPAFFEAARRRSTVTTHCCRAAGVRLRTRAALAAGRAVAADLTGAAWRRHLGLDVETRTPAAAGAALGAITQEHAMTLFEYFLTDKVGHGRIDTPADTILAAVDEALGALLDRLDPSTDTLLVTSDHGNLEDASHTQHTRNPVPLLVHGWAAPYFADATALTDVTPALVAALSAA